MFNIGLHEYISHHFFFFENRKIVTHTQPSNEKLQLYLCCGQTFSVSMMNIDIHSKPTQLHLHPTNKPSL